MRPVTLRSLLCLLLLAACRDAPGRSNDPGHLEVKWEGSSKGRLSGTATASWCDIQRVLAIQVVRGDTGVGLAIHAEKALAPGAYPVVDPARAESVPPAAAVATRWPTKSVIQGFQGDSGRVLLQRSSSGRYSGLVSARARSVVDTQRIRLTGSFRDLLVQADSVGCQPEEELPGDAPEDSDTGVH
jgi:hypothetical protein